MSLEIRFFNVGHGDSILLEFEEGREKKYVVIDSSVQRSKGHYRYPCYEYLKAKGASTISAIVVTHFHQDHILGIEKLLKEFAVKKVIIPPVLSRKTEIFSEQLKKYREKILALSKKTSEPQVIKPALSLAFLLNWISNNDALIEEATGKENVLRIPGIPQLDAHVLLPLARIKGLLQQKIESGDFELDQFPSMNDMSIAVALKYAGKKILLTGDSTRPQWLDHRRQMRTNGIENLDVVCLKASHHGSRENNDEQLYDYFYSPTQSDRFVFVSANGRSHPHDEFFKLVQKYQLQPYCTNLARQCIGPNVSPFPDLTGIPPAMRKFLINYDLESEAVPCQGDIVLTVDSSGIKVANSTGTPCIYRAAV